MANIYLISQSTNQDYDTYVSAVVCASFECIARDMNPRTGVQIDWSNDDLSEWCAKREDVSVKLIGIAARGAIPGVICSSYNAGQTKT